MSCRNSWNHAFRSDGERQAFSIQASSEPEQAHELRLNRSES
jgi:hypothetical protein